MSHHAFTLPFIHRRSAALSGLLASGLLALAVAGCSAAGGEGDFDPQSEDMTEPGAEASDDAAEAAAEAADGSIDKAKRATSAEHPGASCEAANIFGNVICVECTGGPFPSCTTYVCDKDGNNCKETSTRFRATLRALPELQYFAE